MRDIAGGVSKTEGGVSETEGGVSETEGGVRDEGAGVRCGHPAARRCRRLRYLTASSNGWLLFGPSQSLSSVTRPCPRTPDPLWHAVNRSCPVTPRPAAAEVAMGPGPGPRRKSYLPALPRERRVAGGGGQRLVQPGWAAGRGASPPDGSA